MSQCQSAISVVVPVFNSREILTSLYRRISSVLASNWSDYEIIFIDDCSTDDVWLVICELCESDHHVVGVRLHKNVGYDRVLMFGLQHTTSAAVVIMDDDLQHAPEDIPSLVIELEKGYDIVYAQFNRKRYGVAKRLGSRINNKLAEILINKPKGLYLSPFKVVTKELIDLIANERTMFPYMDGLFLQVTASISHITVDHHPRKSGTGNYGFFKSLTIALNFLTGYSILPLRIITYTGVILATLSAISSLILMSWALTDAIEVAGWASTILLILFLGGIQIAGLGVLGEYMGRTYLSVSSRPTNVLQSVHRNSQSPNDSA